MLQGQKMAIPLGAAIAGFFMSDLQNLGGSRSIQLSYRGRA